jgi:hypothetical protein
MNLKGKIYSILNLNWQFQPGRFKIVIIELAPGDSRLYRGAGDAVGYHQVHTRV